MHGVFVASYLGLGLVLLLTFYDPRPALVLWAILFLPFFAVFYYAAARTGWDTPKDFVCPACEQFIPFGSRACPWCGYSPLSAADVSGVQATARKVPKVR